MHLARRDDGVKTGVFTVLPRWQSSPDDTARLRNIESRSNIGTRDQKQVHRSKSASSVAAVYGGTSPRIQAPRERHGQKESPTAPLPHTLGPHRQL